MSDILIDRAHKVLAHAQEEAFKRGHDHTCTEHLFTGLLREESSGGANVLRDMGVNIRKARKAAERLTGKDPGSVTTAGLTPRSKKVIEVALKAARDVGDPKCGTEHLVLGFLEEGQGIAAIVLRDYGVSAEGARSEVLRLREQGKRAD